MSASKTEKTYKVDCVALIDDNEVDNMINQKILESAGFAKHVYTYTSGKSALEFLKNIDRNPGFPDELIPKVVFLDINMPIMNGFSFIDSLEKLSSRIKSRLKIILLTQSDNPNDMQQAKRSKLVSSYLVKPLNAAMVKTLEA
jgi:CheY-like chemotaxis protein